MENHLVKFALLDWITPADGLRFKKYKNGSNVIRLLEFNESFVEKEHCTKGHAAYLLDGSLSIEFDDGMETYNAGDVIFINAGRINRHKVIMAYNQKAVLLVFETEQFNSEDIDYCI